jgi:hypothetical protein
MVSMILTDPRGSRIPGVGSSWAQGDRTFEIADAA